MVYGKRSYTACGVSGIDALAKVMAVTVSLTAAFYLPGKLFLFLNDSTRNSQIKRWSVIYCGLDLGSITFSGFNDRALLDQLHWYVDNAETLKRAARPLDQRVKITDLGQCEDNR